VIRAVIDTNVVVSGLLCPAGNRSCRSIPPTQCAGPRDVVTSGQTPVFDPGEARALLDSIDTGNVAGLRDRAPIADRADGLFLRPRRPPVPAANSFRHWGRCAPRGCAVFSTILRPARDGARRRSNPYRAQAGVNLSRRGWLPTRNARVQCSNLQKFGVRTGLKLTGVYRHCQHAVVADRAG
jgi:hypothetical protein